MPRAKKSPPDPGPDPVSPATEPQPVPPSALGTSTVTTNPLPSVPGPTVKASAPIRAGRLYTLRYRKAIQGVTTLFIEAESFEIAEKVGRAYCAQRAGYKYVALEQAVITASDVGLTPEQLTATPARVGQ